MWGAGGGSAPVDAKYHQVRGGGSSGAWYDPIIDPALIARLDGLAPLYHSFDGTGNLKGLLEAIKSAGGTLSDLSALSGFFYSDWVKAADSVGIPAFDVGANRIPQDMLAVLHRDEAVVPAAFNPWAGGKGMAGQGNERLEALVAQLVSDNRAQAGQIVRLQGQIAKLLQRWDGDGLPGQRKEEVTA